MFSGSSEPGLHTQSRCASLKAGRDKSGSLWSTLTHASPSSLPACRAAWQDLRGSRSVWTACDSHPRPQGQPSSLQL